MNKTTRVAELAARNSYGKLLAILAARSRDIALAEDALAEAFTKALTVWPQKGVPQNPESWLLTVARNGMTDHQRRAIRFPMEQEVPDMPVELQTAKEFPDERLALLMVCAHPAISKDLHTPLMLQTVLGIKVTDIAEIFMVSPTALAKRLVRAKRKIRDAGIPFQIPHAEQLPVRSIPVFEAIYAAHTLDWLTPSDKLGQEALFLADLLTRLLPGDPEAFGLASLIAFSQGRRDARIDEKCLIPIEQQDCNLWDQQLLNYAFKQLARAQKLNKPGRFQLEAAIQSVHIARQETGETDWLSLAQLYAGLLDLAPSTGSLIAQAVVTSHLHGPEIGLQALEKIEQQLQTAFQPLWAARADFLSRAGEQKKAVAAYEKAISLTTELPVKKFLEKQMKKLRS